MRLICSLYFYRSVSRPPCDCPTLLIDVMEPSQTDPARFIHHPHHPRIDISLLQLSHVFFHHRCQVTVSFRQHVVVVARLPSTHPCLPIALSVREYAGD